VGTILDNEPRISISDVTKSEGKKNQTTLFTFTVTLSAAYDQAVTMSFRTVDGTATTGDQDYVARTGTLSFAPGETTKTLTIEVKGDNKKESDETFYLDLFGNSSNSLFTKNRGVGTILNDDRTHGRSTRPVGSLPPSKPPPAWQPVCSPARVGPEHVFGVPRRFHLRSDCAPQHSPGARIRIRPETEWLGANRRAPRFRGALRSAPPLHESHFRQSASATSTNGT
jgi:hypothetical protein